MLFAFFFAFWRFLQILTLIPVIGMLAYFVNGYVQVNQLTPNYILILFIVSILATTWAIFTLFSYHRSSTNAAIVSIVDLLFVGAFIGAVYALRSIANADCTNVTRNGYNTVQAGGLGSASVVNIDVNTDKSCAMLKASFAFGIINAILFFFTAILAWFHGDRLSSRDRKTYYRETHYHRHGHRQSRSPRGSHHSHHSHRRTSFV